VRIIARSLLVLVLLAVVACQTVPLTNRSQLLLIPEGLIYMARAGYHPQAARDLWVRMASQGGARQPEFLSTPR
jgi:hypothetical protein